MLDTVVAATVCAKIGHLRSRCSFQTDILTLTLLDIQLSILQGNRGQKTEDMGN